MPPSSLPGSSQNNELVPNDGLVEDSANCVYLLKKYYNPGVAKQRVLYQKNKKKNISLNNCTHTCTRTRALATGCVWLVRCEYIVSTTIILNAPLTFIPSCQTLLQRTYTMSGATWAWCRYASNNNMLLCRTDPLHWWGTGAPGYKLMYSNWLTATMTSCGDAPQAVDDCRFQYGTCMAL